MEDPTSAVPMLDPVSAPDQPIQSSAVVENQIQSDLDGPHTEPSENEEKISEKQEQVPEDPGTAMAGETLENGGVPHDDLPAPLPSYTRSTPEPEEPREQLAKPFPAEKAEPQSVGGKLRVFLRCYKRQIIWLILFYLLQLLLFGLGIMQYVTKTKTFRLSTMFGYAFGMILQADCGILLVGPALRQIKGFFKMTWIAKIIPFDSWVIFHIVVASTVCAVVCAHVTSMIVGFNDYLMTPYGRKQNITLLWMLQSTGYIGTDFLGYTVISGWIALCCLAVMLLFALPPLRNSRMYDAFYWTHKLQFVFWAALLVHSPDFWKVAVGPLALLVLEKLYKYGNIIRWSSQCRLKQVTLLPGEVTNFVMKRPKGFVYLPGDYVHVRIPSFGIQSWHSFTLSSHPEQQDVLWFHMKASGDFTRSLRNYFAKRSEIQQKIMSTEAIVMEPSNHDTKASPPPKNAVHIVGHLDIPVILDGPYKACNTELFDTEHAVLICGGIGVTPFASVLGSLLEAFRRVNHSVCPKCDHEFPTVAAADPMRINGRRLKLRKVDFIWVVREAHSAEYFADLLRDWTDAQESLAKSSSRLFLECKIFITAKDADAQKSYVRDYFKDPNCGVALQAGRPNWPQLFGELNEQNSGKITVFYCGPHNMKQRLRGLCGLYNYGFTWENFY